MGGVRLLNWVARFIIIDVVDGELLSEGFSCSWGDIRLGLLGWVCWDWLDGGAGWFGGRKFQCCSYDEGKATLCLGIFGFLLKCFWQKMWLGYECVWVRSKADVPFLIFRAVFATVAREFRSRRSKWRWGMMGLAYKVLCTTPRSYYPEHCEVEGGESSCFSQHFFVYCWQWFAGGCTESLSGSGGWESLCS